MEWSDSNPSPCPSPQIHAAQPTTSIQAGSVRVGVKRSISKSYNRKCSLALGVLQFLPALMFFFHGHATGFVLMDYKENATFGILFVSSFLLLLASICPDSSVVLVTLIFSFILLPLPFACVTPNGPIWGHLGNDFGRHSSTVANTWIGCQFIFSLAAFLICCQAFCCGTHGFTEIPRDTINNMEIPRDTLNSMENPRDTGNNLVILNQMATPIGPRNTCNMINFRRHPTASEVTASIYATRANQTNQTDETNDKEGGSDMETRLVVNLDNDDTSTGEDGLPSYQQAITNNYK